MIAIVATIHIKPEMVTIFEQIARDLEAAVAAHEPGCITYRMARSRTDPLTYMNLEIFADQAALDAHIAADYFKSAAVKMRECVSQQSKVEFADTLL